MQTARRYVDAVTWQLAHAQESAGSLVADMERVLRARGAAIAWGGLESNELNALARLAGHPFAPDLPEWMSPGDHDSYLAGFDDGLMYRRSLGEWEDFEATLLRGDRLYIRGFEEASGACVAALLQESLP